MTTHVVKLRRGSALMGCATLATTLLMMGTAGAAIEPTVHLATAAQYAVLGASTVTNTGGSVLNGSLGVSPGTAITGFPPGIVVPPGTTNATNAAAAQARADLTAAYVDAAGRPINATTAADLANDHLQAGVYAGPSKGALQLTGPLVLDGAGNRNSVFIFQTNSSLTTASSSTVTLINGAQECNVFWQVGSSATLGTGSVFVGNIMALTSISLNNGVTVHGRALARNGAVTLINDVFTKPTCAAQSLAPTPSGPTATPPTPGGGSGVTPTPTPGGSAGFTTPGTPTSTPATPNASAGPGAPSGPPVAPPVVGPPRTDAVPLSSGGGFPWSAVAFVSFMSAAGIAGLVTNDRLHARRVRTVAKAAGR